MALKANRVLAENAVSSSCIIGSWGWCIHHKYISATCNRSPKKKIGHPGLRENCALNREPNYCQVVDLEEKSLHLKPPMSKDEGSGDFMPEWIWGEMSSWKCCGLNNVGHPHLGGGSCTQPWTKLEYLGGGEALLNSMCQDGKVQVGVTKKWIWGKSKVVQNTWAGVVKCPHTSVLLVYSHKVIPVEFKRHHVAILCKCRKEDKEWGGNDNIIIMLSTLRFCLN